MRCALLGPLEVVDDAGRRRPVPGSRQRILLAALALRANEPVSRDALAEAVWDGAPPPGFATTLRSHLKRLRQALGPQAARIVTRAPGYLIELRDDELDLAEFETLCRTANAALRAASWEAAVHDAERALALWRGEALADVPSQALRDAHVPRFEQLLVQAHEDHIEAQLQLGRHEQLVQRLQELTTRYPLRERFHVQRMLALAGTGRRAEALAAYQDTRKVLVGELGIEPGSELRAAQERILTGDEPSVAALPESVPLVSGAAHQPWRLPPSARHFTGRRAELDGLIATHPALGFAGVYAIDGAAGIGKTALAVHAAHRLAERFPDGQLFVDLYGRARGRGPRTGDEALEVLLRALAVPARLIPAEGAERARLYRQRLTDTRTLILLDDAADEAQVRPLLTGEPGCLVIVTSRGRLESLEDVSTLSLNLLSPQHAVALLRAMAGPGCGPGGDPLFGEVAQLCGYLPLALRIAGALLRHRPSWTLEHLIDVLRDQRRRLADSHGGDTSLSAVLNLAYFAMPERHRLLLRRLAAVPGPDIDAYGAAALMECDPGAAAGLLEDLTERNALIAYGPGRYRIHSLIREHVGDLTVTDSGHGAAIDRLLHHYAHFAQNTANGPELVRARLRAERENLDAAYDYACAGAHHGNVVDLAWGLADILVDDGPWTRALQVYQTTADSAERSGRRIAHAAALAGLGRVRYLTADYSGAKSAAVEALEIYCALDDRQGEAAALAELGRAQIMTGDYSGAEDALTRALDIYRELGRRDGEAAVLADLGQTRCLSGDYAGAEDALTRALEINRALERRDSEAAVLAELGRIRYLVRDYLGADDVLTQALETYRDLGTRASEASTLIDLGRVRYLAGDYRGAEEADTYALELYRMLGDRRGEAYALAESGRICTLVGDHAGAGDAYRGAVEIYRLLDDPSHEAWVLNHHAATLVATGQRARALTVYRRAAAVNGGSTRTSDHAVALEGLGECQLATGDTAGGRAHLRQALEVFGLLGMAADVGRVQHRLASLRGARHA